MKSYLLRAVTTASLVAVATAFALPAFAEEKEEGKAEKPKKHQYTGEIVSVDAAAKTVTVKKKEGDQKTFTLADKTKYATSDKGSAELTDLKAGEKVTVFYTEEDGKVVATKISPPASKKKEQKAE